MDKLHILHIRDGAKPMNARRVVRALIEGGAVVLAFGLFLLVVGAPIALVVWGVDAVALLLLGAQADHAVWQSVASVATVVAIGVLVIALARAFIALFRWRNTLRGPLYE